MKNFLFSVFAIVLFAFNGNAQELIPFPKDNENVLEFNSKDGKIINSFDLNSAELNNPYYYNFYNSSKNSVTIALNKTEKGLIIEPINTHDNAILVEFYKDNKVVHKYYETNSLKGPSPIEYEPNYSDYLVQANYFDKGEVVWPVIAIVAACCVKVEYTYTSGNPPKHSIKIGWDCNCGFFRTSSNTNKFTVQGQTFEADYILYTIENPKLTNDLNLILSK